MGTFLNIFKVSHNQILYFFNIKTITFFLFRKKEVLSLSFLPCIKPAAENNPNTGNLSKKKTTILSDASG